MDLLDAIHDLVEDALYQGDVVTVSRDRWLQLLNAYDREHALMDEAAERQDRARG